MMPFVLAAPATCLQAIRRGRRWPEGFRARSTREGFALWADPESWNGRIGGIEWPRCRPRARSWRRARRSNRPPRDAGTEAVRPSSGFQHGDDPVRDRFLRRALEPFHHRSFAVHLAVHGVRGERARRVEDDVVQVLLLV